MRSNHDRDAITLSIATALLIFAGVVAVGTAFLLLVDRLIGVGPIPGATGYVLIGGASAVALRYLWRHREP